MIHDLDNTLKTLILKRLEKKFEDLRVTFDKTGEPAFEGDPTVNFFLRNVMERMELRGEGEKYYRTENNNPYLSPAPLWLDCCYQISCYVDSEALNKGPFNNKMYSKEVLEEVFEGVIKEVLGEDLEDIFGEVLEDVLIKVAEMFSEQVSEKVSDSGSFRDSQWNSKKAFEDVFEEIVKEILQKDSKDILGGDSKDILGKVAERFLENFSDSGSISDPEMDTHRAEHWLLSETLRTLATYKEIPGYAKQGSFKGGSRARNVIVSTEILTQKPDFPFAEIPDLFVGYVVTVGYDLRNKRLPGKKVKGINMSLGQINNN